MIPLLLACAPEPAVDPTPRDEVPVCAADCGALPPRPAVVACGAGLAAADPFNVVWPERLSGLGCFDDVVSLAPSAGVYRYEVNSPLWSEGSEKARFVALPGGTWIAPDPVDAWALPVGAVLIKPFSFALADAGGARRPVEVRVMVRTAAGWAYRSYGWDEAAGDAVRYPDTGVWRDVALVVDGAEVVHPWYYPSQVGCTSCHRALAEDVLGVRTSQLQAPVDYGGVWVDQLVALDEAGLLSEPAARVNPLPDPYGDAPVADRARSWLHGNCAHCHRPGGFTPPGMRLDLRWEAPDAGLCDDEPLVVSGHAEASPLYRRITSTGWDRMPPDGATWSDEPGLGLVGAWIDGLTGCP
jgi:mono/diheme cytochrome c family protein